MINVGVHVYICSCLNIYISVTKKCLSDTLAVDSSLQTNVIDFSSNL